MASNAEWENSIHPVMHNTQSYPMEYR